MRSFSLSNQLVRSLCLLVVAGCFPSLAFASNPVVTKLHGRGNGTNAFGSVGFSVAVSDRWVVAGSIENGDPGEDPPSPRGIGAAYVYDARNGRLLRTLNPDDGVPGDDFGWSVAVFGNLALVGARGHAGYEGAAYLFDLRTGRQLRKLTSGVNDNSEFGYSVALTGEYAVVGAPRAPGTESYAGAVFVFDLADEEAAPRQFLPIDGSGSNNDEFGVTVAACGKLVLIGAPRDGFGLPQQAGSAYLFDLESGTQLDRFTSPDPVAFASFGTDVALDGNAALIGSSISPPDGAAYLFDAVNGIFLRTLTASDPSLNSFGTRVALSGNLAAVAARGSNRVVLFSASDGRELRTIAPFDSTERFGISLGLCSNRLVVGADGDDDFNNYSGAAYFYREISGPMSLTPLAKTRDFAPGTVEADFRTIMDPVISPQGDTAFCARLIGPGSGRGTAAKGVWGESQANGALGLVARGGTNLGNGILVNATMKPLYNRADDLVFQGSVRGTGVNGSNNGALFHSASGGIPTAFLRKGDSYPEFSGAVLNQFLEVCQSHRGTAADVAVAFRYRFGPGGVSPISDSGILAVDHDGTLRDFFNEDWFLDSVADTIWAQFTPRAAMVDEQMAWSAFLKGPAVSPADNMGLFQIRPGDFQETWVARKAEAVPGGFMRTFLGEGINPDEVVTYRVSLSAAGQENEKLQFGFRNVWTKGDLVDNIDPEIAPGARIVRLLKFWPVGGDRLIFLTKLSGPGVNGSNDCALWLWDDHNGLGATQLLMREGDFAPDCDGAKIRGIQRVDVSPQTGQYVILVSLTGSPATNQALFTGSSGQPVDGTFATFNLPVMKLRKGTSYQSPLGETTKIRSLVQTNTCDRFGVGAKGGPQVINDQGHFVICVQFTNGAKELMMGHSHLSCDP